MLTVCYADCRYAKYRISVRTSTTQQKVFISEKTFFDKKTFFLLKNLQKCSFYIKTVGGWSSKKVLANLTKLFFDLH
jgi:hypothetical protein